MSGFDLVKITVPSHIVQTLQEMVSPAPQIIVVAPVAEPAPTQVQRTEDGGTIIRIFWVGLKGELLRRIPVSSVMQVGLELFSPPESKAFAGRLHAWGRLDWTQSAFSSPAAGSCRGCSGLPRGTGGRSGSDCDLRCLAARPDYLGRWPPRTLPELGDISSAESYQRGSATQRRVTCAHELARPSRQVAYWQGAGTLTTAKAWDDAYACWPHVPSAGAQGALAPQKP